MAATCVNMRLKQKALAIFENIESRPGPRIDLDQRKALAVDQKVETVEADKAQRDGKRSGGVLQSPFNLWRQIGRPHAAAVTERFARRRGRPLPARAEGARVDSVAKTQDRGRRPWRDALEIYRLAACTPIGGRSDMTAAGAADALDQPTFRISWRRQADFRMRNFQGLAKLR